MQDLHKLIGHEFTIKKLSRTLDYLVQELRPGTVGAMHVTCADESEQECAQAFQKGFVQHHLPELKFASQSPFRLANLGGRYEQGAVGIAENHYKLESYPASFKLMVVKLNTHVGVFEENGQDYYGLLNRYGDKSPCCGALTALLNGHHAPFVDELRSGFNMDGLDRIAMLQDPLNVPPLLKYLYAAIASAGLQARKAVADIDRHSTHSPVLYLVLACVTLNRAGQDSEILCGLHHLDHRSGLPKDHYTGLGDNPSNYSFNTENRRIIVT